MKQSSWKAVIIGAVGSALGGILLHFFTKDLFFSIWNFITTCFIWLLDSLNDSYALSGWLWIPVVILTIIGILTILVEFKSAPEQSEPEYYGYTEDFIKGIKWRWSWHDRSVTKLWCYCPTCDATLVYNDPSVRDFMSNDRGTTFFCENCNNKVVAKIDAGDKDYVLEAVKREILRRIRTNEYQTPNKQFNAEA